MSFNIMHAVDPSRIKPDHFLAIIEISKGSKNKYELDKETGTLILDRVLYTSTHYPESYGFIPKTWGLDGDPLDVLVICSEPIVPMALVRCYPIGVLSMVDSGKSDEKIIAICENDPLYSTFRDIKDLPQHILDEIKHFFSVYKQLEVGKPTEIKGVHGAAMAMKAIEAGIKRYKEKFPNY